MALPSFLIFLCFFFLDWYYFPFLVSVQTYPFSHFIHVGAAILLSRFLLSAFLMIPFSFASF